MAIRFGVSSTVKNRLPRYSNFWDGTAVYSPFSPTGSYDALATYTVPAGGVSSITFAGLPTGGQYQHLQVRCLIRTNRNDVQDLVQFRFNGDTSASNAYHYLGGDGTSAVAGATASTSSPWTALIAGNNASSNIYGVSVTDILDYSNTNKYKTVRTLSGVDTNNTDGRLYYLSNLWMNTSAINSIQILPIYGSSLNQYTQFSVYGVK